MRVLPIVNSNYLIKYQNMRKETAFKGNNNADFFVEYYSADGSIKETIAFDTTKKPSVITEKAFNGYNIPILEELLAAKENGDSRFNQDSQYDTFHNKVLKSVKNEHQASVARYILNNDDLMHSSNIDIYAENIIKASSTKEKAALAKHILDNPKLVEDNDFMNRVTTIINLTKNKRELNVKLEAIDKYAQDGKFSERRIVEGKVL